MSNKTKLLLVDDNQEYLELLTEFLTASSYEVMPCSNGREALIKFTEFLPDIIVTDIVMPEVDGIELLLALRKINPESQVILMSGGNKGHASSYLQMAEKLGGNVILAKPFSLDVLLAEIKKLEAIGR